MAFCAIEETHFGVSMFPTDYSIQPVELAIAVEERGLDSLFFPEHTHIPASRKSPFPGGGDLPKQYWHSHDPFVALGAAAAVTERILLGTGICLIIERDPITTAKEIASLDMISKGRSVIGIGAGWNREEMENHGANFLAAGQLSEKRYWPCEKFGRRRKLNITVSTSISIRFGHTPNLYRKMVRRFGLGQTQSGSSIALPTTLMAGCPSGV